MCYLCDLGRTSKAGHLAEWQCYRAQLADMAKQSSIPHRRAKRPSRRFTRLDPYATEVQPHIDVAQRLTDELQRRLQDRGEWP